MNGIAPCLWFDDQSEDAAAFYTGLFPDSRVTAVSRYPEGFDNPAGRPRGSVMTVEMVLAGSLFTALNGGPAFTINPSISFFVHTETREDTDRTFAALADGGSVMMPLQAYPWSERYGWVQDRFGVSWQVMLGSRDGVRDTIVPCLMFCGDQHGRAEEAMELYTGVFEDAGPLRLAEGPLRGVVARPCRCSSCARTRRRWTATGRRCRKAGRRASDRPPDRSPSRR